MRTALLVLSVLLSFCRGQSQQHFPEFTIDMLKKPEERFVEVAKHFREEIIETSKLYLTQVPQFAIDMFDWTSWMWWVAHYEQYQEIKGIIDAVDSSEVTISTGILLNSLYELESWCTSIVAQMNNGTIIHSRNLDFDNADHMRKLTFKAKFVKQGKEKFEAIMFAGTIGVYTGIKKGGFSISENQRWPEMHTIGLAENLAMIFSGFREISWLIRDTLEKCDDYQCAHKLLSEGKINALGYIILAGTKADEGVVIARNRLNTAHEDKLNHTAGKWYVVQTNNDHWRDHGCYNRCASAHKNLDLVGNEAINIQNIRQNVLLNFPNFNGDTLYNSQFVPAENFTDTISIKYSPQKDYDERTQVKKILEDKGRPFNMKTDLSITNPSDYPHVLQDLIVSTFY